MSVHTPLRVGFLLLPGAQLLALAGPLDALQAANALLSSGAGVAGGTGASHASPTPYTPYILTLDGQPALGPPQAAGGTLSAAGSLALLPTLHAVFIVSDHPLPDAARDGHAALHSALHAALRERAAAGATLGGIGTGAAVLAQAGVLAGHRATLHWAHGPQLAEQHAQVVVSSKLYEIDRGRLSCAGGTASLDLFIAWLGQRHGERLAQDLLAHFGLERLRPRDEDQRAPVVARTGHGAPKLTEAVALMEANLDEPLPTDDIARLVGVSRRQLERLFKQHLDELPSRYYARLRITRARRLLQQTSQSILQIGLACGFTSGSHFSNAYRAHFGHTPRDERSQRAAAWRQQQVAPAAPPPPHPLHQEP